MFFYFGIQLLCIVSYINCHTLAFHDKSSDKNKTSFKYVIFNKENQNSVCIIAEMKVIIVIKNELYNITPEINVGENATTFGNCTSFDRKLWLTNGEIEVFFNWIRDPDPYEFGEIGWSSVGAPANTTSGTYTLSKIFLKIPASLLVKDPDNDFKVYFENLDNDRFKTRSGDFYVCETRIGYDMALLNSSMFINATLLKVKLEFENMRMQAFSDVNVSDFTGTGQLCHNDLPSDSGVSIGIGVAVSVLVVAVLAFLAIGRLKEKDQQYQEIDASKYIPTKT